MTRTHAKGQGQSHLVQKLEWKQTDGRTEAIALASVLTRSVEMNLSRSLEVDTSYNTLPLFLSANPHTHHQPLFHGHFPDQSGLSLPYFALQFYCLSFPG